MNTSQSLGLTVTAKKFVTQFICTSSANRPSPNGDKEHLREFYAIDVHNLDKRVGTRRFIHTQSGGLDECSLSLRASDLPTPVQNDPGVFDPL